MARILDWTRQVVSCDLLELCLLLNDKLSGRTGQYPTKESLCIFPMSDLQPTASLADLLLCQALNSA